MRRHKLLKKSLHKQIYGEMIMKCQNCGNEFEGKFCPQCGTPVAQAPNVDQQPNQTSFGQQFTNPNTAPYSQQTFTNQPNIDANGKKKMSGGKIAAIIISIVLGVLILLGIIVGVVACNVVNGVKKVVDSGSSYISQAESWLNENSDDNSDWLDDSSDGSVDWGSIWDDYRSSSKLNDTESVLQEILDTKEFREALDTLKETYDGVMDIEAKVEGNSIIYTYTYLTQLDDSMVKNIKPAMEAAFEELGKSYDSMLDEFKLGTGLDSFSFVFIFNNSDGSEIVRTEFVSD